MTDIDTCIFPNIANMDVASNAYINFEAIRFVIVIYQIFISDINLAKIVSIQAKFISNNCHWVIVLWQYLITLFMQEQVISNGMP